MIKVNPGSVKDVKTLLPSMDEIKLNDAILIVDHGFVSDEVLGGIFDCNCSAMVPQRRNSDWYNIRIHLTYRFIYLYKRLIRGEKGRLMVRYSFYLKIKIWNLRRTRHFLSLLRREILHKKKRKYERKNRKNSIRF